MKKHLLIALSVFLLMMISEGAKSQCPAVLDQYTIALNASTNLLVWRPAAPSSAGFDIWYKYTCSAGICTTHVVANTANTIPLYADYLAIVLPSTVTIDNSFMVSIFPVQNPPCTPFFTGP